MMAETTPPAEFNVPFRRGELFMSRDETVQPVVTVAKRPPDVRFGQGYDRPTLMEYVPVPAVVL